MQLSKSDFLEYRQCAKSFWLRKRKPAAVVWPTPSEFDRMLMNGGYAVEAIARNWVATWSDSTSCRFQKEFLTDDGLYARADLVKTLSDGSVDIFEIKASTSLKPAGHDHIIDAAFQTIVAEKAGERVNSIFVMHVNKDFVRRGEIDPSQFLQIIDVTQNVRAVQEEIGRDALAALHMLADEIDEAGCDCRQKSRANHCDAFDYFNPAIPTPSVYMLPRISTAKLQGYVAQGHFGLADISEQGLTAPQVRVLQSARRNAPVVDVRGIRNFVDQLAWPLYFFDYETHGAAVPTLDGVKPYEQLPVQYSLHVLTEEGELDHHEFLASRHGEQAGLIAGMRQQIGERGNLISWNKSFEAGCNERLAALHPDQEVFLRNLNSRTVDLMDVFKEHYVDARFGGSTSIKKVLPVVCPHLRYDERAVHDGGGAMDAWIRMIESNDETERKRLADELRAYCKLDTLAMVEIFRFLRQAIAA